jgi:hypothetical protein
MVTVRRIFSELASGTSVNGVCTASDANGVPPPGSGTKKWQRTFVRDCTVDDVYASHTVEELKPWPSPQGLRGADQQSSTASGGKNVGKRGSCAYPSP